MTNFSKIIIIVIIILALLVLQPIIALCENTRTQYGKSSVTKVKENITIKNNINLTEEIIEDLPEKILEDKELPIGTTGKFKAYMDYRAITNKKSMQWELQQEATTDEQGFRRYNELYMVALGTYYSPQVGIEFEIELSTGKVIYCITGDVKSDYHTDSTHRYSPTSGNIVEFIMDTKLMEQKSKQMGDVSYSGLEGSVIRISLVKNLNLEE